MSSSGLFLTENFLVFLTVDFCRKKQFPCQNGGTCENKDDGYICRCKIGFDGNNCEHMHGN